MFSDTLLLPDGYGVMPNKNKGKSKLILIFLFWFEEDLISMEKLSQPKDNCDRHNSVLQ